MSFVTALAVAILATSAQGRIPVLKGDLRGLWRLRLLFLSKKATNRPCRPSC